MAAGTTLQLVLDAGGVDRKFNINRYGNASASVSSIKAFGTALTQNASIFKYPYASLKSAKASITSETEFQLDND